MSDSNKLKQIANIRREYISNGLRRKDISVEPLELFEHWLNQACNANITDPTAMIFATVDKLGQPYQRIVLLKHYDKRGLVFYTNLDSRKAYHIKNNPRVSLLFPWHMLERQVIISGKAERLSITEEIRYFYSRPYNSQISAWISKQSKYISTRDVLEDKFLKLKERLQQGKIPYPRSWGGFRISIEQIEFWQGGKHRLHDRFLYQISDRGWKIYRLAP